jgi:molecular chaperone DnaK
MASGNKTIGRFHLDGIPPAPRGIPQIEVAFDIDANGIINVSAKDMATNKLQKITITASSGLNKDEIENIVKDAEAHRSEDQKKKEAIDTKNQAESLVYNVEKSLKEAGDKVTEQEKKDIEAAAASLKEKIKNEASSEDLKKSMEELTNKFHTVAQKMYAGAQPGAAGAPGAETGAAGAEGAGEKKDKDGVVDAEYEVVDEDKKKK